MKKLRKRILIGTAAALAATGFVAGCNRPESVYGPPPDVEYESVSSSSEEVPSSVSFSPEENDPECVYGPPPEEEYEPVSPADFDPEENIPEDVYGPPSFFGEDGD